MNKGLEYNTGKHHYLLEMVVDVEDLYQEAVARALEAGHRLGADASLQDAALQPFALDVMLETFDIREKAYRYHREVVLYRRAGCFHNRGGRKTPATRRNYVPGWPKF